MKKIANLQIQNEAGLGIKLTKIGSSDVNIHYGKLFFIPFSLLLFLDFLFAS